MLQLVQAVCRGGNAPRVTARGLRKMYCTLSRTQSDMSSISDWRKATSPLKPLEQQTVANFKDYTESSVILQNIHNRCALLTFLTLASDGNWKILAVPVQCLDNTNQPTGCPQHTDQSSCGSNIRKHRATQNSNLLPEKKVDRTVKTSRKARKKRKQGKNVPQNGGSRPVGISELVSHQSDLQVNLNVDRDASEAISPLSDHNVPEKFPVFGPANLLKSDDVPFSDSQCSNGSSELDIALVSPNSGEGLKIDSGESDRGTVDIRHKEGMNSYPGPTVMNNVIDLADQHKEVGSDKGQNASKKSYRVKTAFNSPGASCILGNSHFHAHNMGKENSHPVWQKVHRKPGNESGSVKVNNKVLGSNEAPRNEDEKQTLAKFSGKLKRKHFGPKQECSRHLRNASPFNKFKLRSSNRSAHSDTVNVSEVVSPCGSPRDRSRTGNAESLNHEPTHGSSVCCDGLQLNGDNSNCTANSDNECLEDGDSSMGEGQVELSITNSAMCLPLLADGVAQSDKEVAIPESCRHKSTSSGSTTQKWVPVGMKIHASTGLTSRSSISVGHCHAEAHQVQTLNVNPASKFPSSSISEVKSGFSPHEEKGQSKAIEDHNSHISEDQKHRVASSSSVCRKFESQLHTDSDRIVTAIDHAHRAQLASEAVQMATGGPIAEIETLLHLSSPVLCLSHSTTNCKMCSRSHSSSSSLCIHERPDIPLRCLWEWYQKHGCFGLEIQGKDYNNSKRLGIDRFSFRAYFVPYLSAVQLFRKRQERKSPAGDPGICQICDNTNVGHLSIFPLLVPWASNNGITSQVVEGSESHEAEVIFEYFELEQPQQRWPLYEKIQELVRDNGLSRDKAYGDPSLLNSTNLQDLDPRSWYSVAWYPIYRIPDGKFRAAFLTYHSLGHLVRRNGIEDCVVSPVVGLQNYNAQGECWFQMRPSIMSQAPQFLSLDPSKILTERLRALEEAAASMSRATVSKGSNLTSVNKHPDYEFFLSRRSYY